MSTTEGIEKKGEETILKAAFEVIDEQTISNASMRSIAHKADMVLSNLHYYFRSKEELLLALLRYITKDFAQMRTTAVEQMDDGVKAKLYGFLEQKKDVTLNKSQYDRVMIDFWSMGQINPNINQTFKDLYNQWRAHIKGVVQMYDPKADEKELHLLSAMMVSLMMGSTLQYLNDEDSFDIDDYYEACKRMVSCHLDNCVLAAPEDEG